MPSLTSTDPIAEAYYAARAAYDGVAVPDECTEEAAAVRTAAVLACQEAVAALGAAADPGNPEIWHAMAHLCRAPLRFRTAEEFLEERRARNRLRRKPSAAEERDEEERAREVREAAGEFWERKAAEAGHCGAMVLLAHWLNRRETPDAKEEGLEWLQRAAGLGSTSAMVSLGFHYRGMGDSPEGLRLAGEWFRRAVDAGDVRALVHMGTLHAWYLRDPVEGLRWLLRAAEVGCTDAFIYVADLLADRRSVVHDPEEALRWYHRVAESGSGSAARAMLELAKRYRDGCGTVADRGTAREWLVRCIDATRPGSPRRTEAEAMLRSFDESLL